MWNHLIAWLEDKRLVSNPIYLESQVLSKSYTKVSLYTLHIYKRVCQHQIRGYPAIEKQKTSTRQSFVSVAVVSSKVEPKIHTDISFFVVVISYVGI